MSKILRIGGNLIDLSRPKVMAVLNVTPDSFFSASRHQTPDSILKFTEDAIESGASIIDIGGCSTRPGAVPVGEEDEYERLRRAISAIRSHFPTFPLSVDSFRFSIIEKLVDEFGPFLVNDISGGSDVNMFKTVSRYHLPYVLCHFNDNNVYQNMVTDMLHFFSQKISLLNNLGVYDIIVDPNFGFAKNDEQNLSLVRSFEKFKVFEYPLLAGVSRKRFICHAALCETDNSLSSTSAIHMLLLQNGAGLLRVHDTREAIQVIRLFEKCCTLELN